MCVGEEKHKTMFGPLQVATRMIYIYIYIICRYVDVVPALVVRTGIVAEIS